MNTGGVNEPHPLARSQLAVPRLLPEVPLGTSWAPPHSLALNTPLPSCFLVRVSRPGCPDPHLLKLLPSCVHGASSHLDGPLGRGLPRTWHLPCLSPMFVGGCGCLEDRRLPVSPISVSPPQLRRLPGCVRGAAGGPVFPHQLLGLVGCVRVSEGSPEQHSAEGHSPALLQLPSSRPHLVLSQVRFQDPPRLTGTERDRRQEGSILADLLTW